MPALNYKMKRFAFEFAKDGHGTNSAIRAGYAEPSAHDAASRLLKNEEILALIEEHKATNAQAATLSFARIIQELMDKAFADVSQIMKIIVKPCGSCWPLETVKLMIENKLKLDPNPECKACGGEGHRSVWLAETDTLPPAVRKLITGIEQRKDGIKISIANQFEYLKLLATICGMVVDKKELSGPGGGPIQMGGANEKPLHLWTREEISAERARRQLQNSALGVLAGVSETAGPLTIDAKQLTD